MQLLHAWTGLGRPLSPAWYTHRILLLCIAVAFGTAAGLQYFLVEQDWSSAAAAGFRIAGAVFLSWALARELHPDAPWAAFGAVALCTVGLWFWPRPDLLLLFHTLLLLRLINRSTGIPAKPLDVLLLLGLTAWLLYLGHLMAGVLAAVAFWSNGRLPAPQEKHKFLILPVVIAFAWAIAYQPHLAAPQPLSTTTTILVIALATGFALFARGLKEVKSLADADNTLLYYKRVQSAQVLTLLVTTIFTLWYGDEYFEHLIPLWASFGGIFFFAAIFRTPQEHKKKQYDNTEK